MFRQQKWIREECGIGKIIGLEDGIRKIIAGYKGMDKSDILPQATQ